MASGSRPKTQRFVPLRCGVAPVAVTIALLGLASSCVTLSRRGVYAQIARMHRAMEGFYKRELRLYELTPEAQRQHLRVHPHDDRDDLRSTSLPCTCELSENGRRGSPSTTGTQRRHSSLRCDPG